MDALQAAPASLGEDLLDVLDSLFILLERNHSKFTLFSVLSLLETLPDNTVFSFLSNIPCDISSVEWIVQCLLSDKRTSSASLLFRMVFYCKWADGLKQIQSFPLLGINILEFEQVNRSLEEILKNLKDIVESREIPYLDAFLVYLFHGDQCPSTCYQPLVQHLLSSRNELIYRFIEILLKERKPWQFQSMCTFFSVVNEISPHYMIPLIQLCPCEEYVDLFLSHWLQHSGLSTVTTCLRGSLSQHLKERLFVVLLSWSQSVSETCALSIEEEELIDTALCNPPLVLQVLRNTIPPTGISDSHFGRLLHAIIKKVGSDESYIPLLFLTAHDPQYHSSALIESCHNLVNNCLNQQLGIEYRSPSKREVSTETETPDDSLFSLFKQVSISAVFLLLLGAKDVSTISTLFIAMMIEAGIKDKKSIQEIKNILLFPPVLSDILHHSSHPLILLYLFEFIDSNKLDPSICANALFDILSKPMPPIPYNDLVERNHDALQSIKELHGLSWNVGFFFSQKGIILCRSDDFQCSIRSKFIIRSFANFWKNIQK